MSFFATKEEIENLTGCRTVAAQTQWFSERNIPIVTNMLGQLIISRDNVAYYNSTKNHKKLDSYDVLLSSRAGKGKVSIDRKASGIYLLKKEEAIVYVGQTTNFLSRAANHSSNPNFDFDEIIFIPAAKSKLNLYEHELIARLCPKYNVMHNNFVEPIALKP
jgi:hypothetical protein